METRILSALLHFAEKFACARIGKRFNVAQFAAARRRVCAAAAGRGTYTQN
jgi:hypothetical protein